MNEHRKEACRTYLEQTKLLVALASALLIGPAAIFGFVRPETGVGASRWEWWLVLLTETALVLSVLSGYVVFATIVGSQEKGDYDVYRPATRWASLVQLGLLACAMLMLALLTSAMIQTPLVTRRQPSSIGPIR
jgi:hypothetical protein